MPDKTGIGALYKYRRCETGAKFSNVTDMLLGKLWFSPLGEFNDPFEGLPRYVPAHADPDEQQKAMLLNLKAIARKRGLKGRERFELLDRAKNRKFGREMIGTESLHDLLTKQSFVFSVTAKHDQPLMWSHYANEHKGICVHFNPKSDPLTMAMFVDYDERYPEIPIPLPDDVEDLLISGTLRKAKYWEYESEYRVVSIRGGNPSWHVGVKWENDSRIAVMDPAGITGVTLGVRMPEPVRNELRAWRDLFRPDIPLYDATLSSSEYKLEFGKAY